VSSGGVNPHSVRLDRQNRWLYVPHLGSDEIRIYPFDDNSGQVDVSKGRSVTLPKGTGPRHLAFSPDERFMYVLSELTGKVYAFSRDASTGQLTQFQSESSLPEDTAMVPGQPRAATGTAGGLAFDEAHAIYAADIQITPDGRHLYTSERTQSVLSRFEIEPATGRLRFVEKVPTEAQPRGFAIDSSGRFLVASGQKSSTVSLYAIDPKTGVLQLRQKVVSGKGANWVSIVDTP
jgi:6-phosphogluconolactonase